jgi:hypothetical protein
MEERRVYWPGGEREWSACAYGASVFLVIWFFSQDLHDALKFSAFFVLFNCLPSVVLLDLLFPQWRNQRSPSLLLIAFAPVGGLIVLLPWWAADLKWGYFLVPVAAQLLLFGVSRNRAIAPANHLRQWPQLLFVMVALLGASFVSLAPIWVEGLNPHLLYQAAIAAKLDTGFPPEFPFIAGVPLAYNYAAHVWMTASSYLTGIPIENVVAYAAPALLLYCSAAALASLGFCAGLNAWIVGLVVCCAFWYAGWTPIGSQLFGRAFSWSSVLLIGPLLAFCAFLVLVVALADWFSAPDTQGKVRAYTFAFLVMLVVVASRAPGAIILLCAVSFFIFWETVIQRRLNFFSLGMLAVLAVATFLGLVVFLRYGSNFSPGGFTKISPTPFPYLASYSFFWLPPLLIAKGIAPVWVGVLQFAILVFGLAGFLTPFLAWRISASPRSCLPLEVLLFGAGMAGLAAIFFLESPGGSHFTFLHYSTLAFTLLGGIALSKITAMRTRQFYAAVAIAGVLALVQIREIPFRALPGMIQRLAPATSPRRMAARQCLGEPPLEKTETALPAGAAVVLPADVDMCARLRLMIQNPQANFYLEESLRLIADWETSLKADLTRKVALLNESPKVLAAALPSPSYVMVRRADQVSLQRADTAH